MKTFKKLKFFMIVVIGVYIALTILRIVFYFTPSTYGRDIDLKLLYYFHKENIFNYYKQYSAEFDAKPLYLYFWYFIFYPFSMIPYEICLYIWDFLRLISILYITKKIPEFFNDDRILGYALLLQIVGFFFDIYFNNTNWLIYLLIFESYIQLKKGNKIISGILFAISTYKVILVLFPLILIIARKIRVKDLIYYFIPFFLMVIPYFIFPSYFLEMYQNWSYIEYNKGIVLFNNEYLWMFYQAIWQGAQPAQLLFIGFIYLIFFQPHDRFKIKQIYAVLAFYIIGLLVLFNLLMALFTYIFILGDPNKVFID
ncbi:MAG: glycosyltransferase family 87 protein [Promethearchaeota archaeon]